MSKLHELKILPEYFDEIINGSKTFELRRYDRDFKTGDRLLLREHNGKNYTGCNVKVLVTNILENFQGLENGFCVLGFKIEKIKL